MANVLLFKEDVLIFMGGGELKNEKGNLDNRCLEWIWHGNRTEASEKDRT